MIAIISWLAEEPADIATRRSIGGVLALPASPGQVSAVVASLVLVGTVLLVDHRVAVDSRTVSHLVDRFLAFLVADILAHTSDKNPVAVCKASLVPSAGSASVRETR